MSKYPIQERRSCFCFPKQFRFLLLTVALTVIAFVLLTRLPSVYKTASQPIYLISHMYSQTQKVTEPPRTAVFLCVDSTLLKDSSDIANTVKKWSVQEPVIQTCTAENHCSVQIILYDEDQKTTAATVRESLKKLFQPASSNSTAAPTSIIHTIPKRTDDARKISETVMKAYISGVSYFMFVTSLHFEGSNTLGTGMKELKDEMSNRSPRDVGALQFTSGDTAKLNSTVSGFLVSKLHIEIFGELFPFEIATLPSALSFLSTIYPPTMSRRFDQGSIKAITPTPITRNFTDLTGAFMQEQKEVLQGYLKAVQDSNDCLRCNLHSSKNIIAMSVYGASPRYTYGALRNAQLFPVIFPGWRLWFYTEQEPKDGKRTTSPVPVDIATRVIELGAEFRYVDVKATGLAPMLWRFTVFEELDVELFTVRDCDSRLTLRDAAVIREWLKTDKPFHCIRDHPSHSGFSVSGGLWGGRPARLREIFNGSLNSVMRRYGGGYVEDMHFLGRDVWPKVKDNYAMCHDSFSCQRYPSSHPFPVARKGYEHLGQVYDEHSIGRKGDIDILKAHGVNAKCSPS